MGKPQSPSCIIAQPGDKKTLCGKKTADVPHCWAPFVQAHIDGHGAVFCPECARRLSTASG